MIESIKTYCEAWPEMFLLVILGLCILCGLISQWLDDYKSRRADKTYYEISRAANRD